MVEEKNVATKVNTSSSELPENCIKVSLEKTPTFYASIGRRLLSPPTSSSSVKNCAFDEVVIAGLGVAIKTAIATSSIMEKQKIGEIKKIYTEYYSSDKSRKKTPKLTIVVKKIYDNETSKVNDSDANNFQHVDKDADGETNPENAHM